MGLPKMTALAATLLLINQTAAQEAHWRMKKQQPLSRYPIGKHGKSGVARAKRAARKNKG